jgi:hypothetical protein
VIDEEAVRAETPGCLDRVFLDSAGSSLPPQRVVRAVVAHLEREAEVGGYRAAAERATDLDELKRSLGRLLGGEAASIALMDSCTRAWTQFLRAIPFAAGDRVLIGRRVDFQPVIRPRWMGELANAATSVGPIACASSQRRPTSAGSFPASKFTWMAAVLVIITRPESPARSK